MRHPPSVCCLFGRTGCLTAQAVAGILMVMTNDSLSIPPDSFLLPIPPLLLVFCHFIDKMVISQLKCSKCIIHLLLMRLKPVTCTCLKVFRYKYTLDSNSFILVDPAWSLITHWWVDMKSSLLFLTSGFIILSTSVTWVFDYPNNLLQNLPPCRDRKTPQSKSNSTWS